MPRLHSCRCGVWSKVWECFLYILDMFLCLLKIEFSSLVWACVSSCQSVSDHINFDAVHIGGKKNVQCCHPQMEKYQKATFPSTTKCIMTMLYYIRKTYDHAMKPQMYFVRRDQMKLSGHHRQNSACFFFFSNGGHCRRSSVIKNLTVRASLGWSTTLKTSLVNVRLYQWTKLPRTHFAHSQMSEHFKFHMGSLLQLHFTSFSM